MKKYIKVIDSCILYITSAVQFDSVPTGSLVRANQICQILILDVNFSNNFFWSNFAAFKIKKAAFNMQRLILIRKNFKCIQKMMIKSGNRKQISSHETLP